MRRLCAFLLFSMTTLTVQAHDPRTTAKEVGVRVAIEGEGNITLRYKSLHFNQPVYEKMKSDPQFLAMINQRVWNNIGSAQFEFDVVVGGVSIPKGTYEFGLNVESGDQFSLVLVEGSTSHKIPLEVEPTLDMPYLTFAIAVTEQAENLLFEGRCGKFRGTVSVVVPGLKEHLHPDEMPAAEQPAAEQQEDEHGHH
ncbi:MAG: hypothetical protein HY645_10155 [Acidobacteria bacterium]|nr:hypothetical protein [Acidobacteriota bacterium]